MASNIVDILRNTSETAIDLSPLLEAWLSYIGTDLPPICRLDALDWHKKGVSLDVMLSAVQETARAPRPSWRYLCAIVEACMRDGCYTAADWQRRKARERPQYARMKTTHSAWYEGQRQYTDKEYAEMAFDLLSVEL